MVLRLDLDGNPHGMLPMMILRVVVEFVAKRVGLLLWRVMINGPNGDMWIIGGIVVDGRS